MENNFISFYIQLIIFLEGENEEDRWEKIFKRGKICKENEIYEFLE